QILKLIKNEIKKNLYIIKYNILKEFNAFSQLFIVFYLILFEKMLFFNFLQTLIEKQVVVTVELKNDLQITGTLHSIDQYLNIKLNNTTVNQNESFIHLGSLKNCFIRGSVVRYIFFPPSEVDIELLQKACRKELRSMNDCKEKQK
ncbi:U6 snRNA-associated Sm-like protein LSm2, partial [Cryptosporidium parvum]